MVLSNEQEKINELAFSAKKIGLMGEDELNKNCAALLLRIHVITGWAIPTGAILNVFNDQFRKKILEDYASFNVEEIVYAFRHSGTLVQDWGKEMNLSLIDKVLWPYEIKRREAGRILERKQPPPPKKPYDPEEVLNQYRYDIETAFQAIRTGHRPIIHVYFKETLVNDGLMKEEENINDFLVREVNNPNRKNLYVRD